MAQQSVSNWINRSNTDLGLKEQNTTWQSIETAPRDWTPILVCAPHVTEPWIVKYDTQYHQFVPFKTNPTHWMPLPKPL